MQLIKRLKSLGLDLKRIKGIIGDVPDHRTLREVLQSLRFELLKEKNALKSEWRRLRNC